MRELLDFRGWLRDPQLRRADFPNPAGGGPRFGYAVSWGVIAVAIGLVTILIAATGGAPTPLAHLYYVPILYAATSHGHRGVLVAAVGSGLAVGPWMPAPGAADGVQGVRDWGVRLALFVVVGLVASWLASQDARSFDLMLRDIVLGIGLRSAVRNKHLLVHYQPLIDLVDGKVLGAEALCRWSDIRGRPVAPDMFISAAEHTGAIMAVGREVLRQATGQSDDWVTEIGAGLTMSVNVSAVQLCRPEFLVDLTTLAGSAAARQYTLCIEVTETAIIADRDKAFLVLTAARAMGVLVAIDDFGTGQSSLAYLAGFPIDIIKIDQSFVAAIDSDETAYSLVRAIVGIAASLGAVTIAEGIESPGQLQALRGLGCDIGQGHYLGRPSDPNDFDWSPREMK